MSDDKPTDQPWSTPESDDSTRQFTTVSPDTPDGHAPTSAGDAGAGGGSGVGEQAGDSGHIGGFVGTTEPEAKGRRGGDGGGEPGKRTKKRNFFRRHLALTTLGVIVLLILGSAGGFVWYLNHELGNIPHFQATHISPANPSGGSDSGQPLNILLLGADNGTSTNTVANELADGHWTPGSHRSDTIILLHIPANRKTAQLVSIPRDSWVKVPGFPGDVGGYAKINAAFSWGGPDLAAEVVTNLTHVKINHIAIMDWNGLKGLTDALGGVRVYIPQTFTDDSQHITWHQGWQTLNGTQALAYVRTRHGLTNGDFGRIQRQQNFMRTIMGQLLSSGTFTNPLRLAHVVGSLAGFIEVDSTWTTSDIRTLALSLRNLRTADVQFATAPFGSYDVVAGQDIVRLDQTKLASLMTQFLHGNIQPYLNANPTARLPSTTGVH